MLASLTYTHTITHTYTQTHTHIHTHRHTHAYTHRETDTLARTHRYTYLYTQVPFAPFELGKVQLDMDTQTCARTHTRTHTLICTQVPFAPFESGTVQQDMEPVFEFQGKHAFRGIDHHWGRCVCAWGVCACLCVFMRICQSVCMHGNHVRNGVNVCVHVCINHVTI